MYDYFEVHAERFEFKDQETVRSDIEIKPCTKQDFEKYFPDQPGILVYDPSYFLCSEDLSNF